MKYILIISLLFFSCKSKKVSSEITRVDTLIVTKEIIRTLPSATYIQLDKVCDSLGNLRPLHFTATTGKNSVVVTSQNGNLQISTQIDSDTITNSNTYQSTNQNKVIVKERAYIPTWVKTSVLFNIALLIYLVLRIRKALGI